MLKVEWTDVERICQELGQRIRQFTTGPEYIYGVPRGGLIPATIFSHMMGVPLIIDEMAFRKLANDGHRILLVDDINDTGRTLSQLRLGENVQTIVLYEREGTRQRADWVGEMITHTGWLLMPWENQRRAFEDMADYLERRHLSHELATNTKS